jgi:hypothetical protein
VHRTKCFKWTKTLVPLLEKALGRSVVMPKRQINSIEEFLEICPDARDLFIDGTERQTQRPKNNKLKIKRYSGKKKAHTRKNIIISDEKRKILYVSPSKDGKIHDLKQLKKTGVLEHIPKETTIWVDKGFYGIKKSLSNNNDIMMPKKKSKKHPLTEEEKKENQAISSIRIVVEHAINGIKRYGIMSGIYRNRRGQDDKMINLCAGLWNFHLQNS